MFMSLTNELGQSGEDKPQSNLSLLFYVLITVVQKISAAQAGLHSKLWVSTASTVSWVKLKGYSREHSLILLTSSFPLWPQMMTENTA